jgi:hypothetical protein
LQLDSPLPSASHSQTQKKGEVLLDKSSPHNHSYFLLSKGKRKRDDEDDEDDDIKQELKKPTDDSNTHTENTA